MNPFELEQQTATLLDEGWVRVRAKVKVRLGLGLG